MTTDLSKLVAKGESKIESVEAESGRVALPNLTALLNQHGLANVRRP